MHVVTWSSNTQGGLGPNPQELCGEECAETAEGAMTGAKGGGRADSRAAEAGGRDTAGKWTREKKPKLRQTKQGTMFVWPNNSGRISCVLLKTSYITRKALPLTYTLEYAKLQRNSIQSKHQYIVNLVTWNRKFSLGV